MPVCLSVAIPAPVTGTHRYLTRFNPGKVEHIVQRTQQAFTVLFDNGQIGALLPFTRIRRQQGNTQRLIRMFQRLQIDGAA